MRTRAVILGVVAALAVSGAAYGARSGASPAASTPTAGKAIAGTHCPTFPADNYWHADIRKLPVDPRSRQWLSHMSTSVDLHPDFGPSFGAGPQLRHPGHRGRPHPRPGPGALRLLHRERPRALPAGKRHPDRGWPQLDRRPARRHRRPRHLPPLRDVRDPGAQRTLVRRLRRDVVADVRPAPPQRLDLGRRGGPADPARAAAVERGEGAAHRPRHPVHHRRHLAPPPVAGPARRRLTVAAGPTRRWGPASACARRTTPRDSARWPAPSCTR